MLIIWLLYLIFLIIFFIIGWTAAFYAKKYSTPGDLTKKATLIYAVFMFSIALISMIVVINNGVNASFSLEDFKGFFNDI